MGGADFAGRFHIIGGEGFLLEQLLRLTQQEMCKSSGAESGGLL